MLFTRCPLTEAWRAAVLLLIVALGAVTQAPGREESASIVNSPWHYVVPTTGDSQVLSARTLWLSTDRPSDLAVDIPTPGAQFAELRYGSSDSRRVALVLTKNHSAGQQLYVDRDRDRKITAQDRLTDAGPLWQFRLDAEFVTPIPNLPTTASRQVLLRRGTAGRTLTLSTLGFLEGRLQLDAGAVQARVADIDANGRFGDADDVLWCDIDRDGTWNSFLERFSCTPVIRMAGRRYQFAADEYGRSFQAGLLSGTGSLRFDLGFPVEEVIQHRILLVGRDGLAISATTNEQLDEIPVGEYRIATLSLTLRDTGGGRPWNYLFSGARSGKNVEWCEVLKNHKTRFHLLDGLGLSVEINEPKRSYGAGESFFATPQLRTDSGLIINNCWRGDDRQSWARGGGCATIRLGDASNSTVAATSGFA